MINAEQAREKQLSINWRDNKRAVVAKEELIWMILIIYSEE